MLPAGFGVLGFVDHSLGDLGHRDPGRGQVLHQGRPLARLPRQAVDSLGPPPVEPPLQVLQQHACIPAGSRLGDRTLGDGDFDGVVLGPRHFRRRRPARAPQFPKGIRGRLHVKDMGDPSPEKALLGLPLFVGPDRFGRHLVHLGVAARQRGGHAADGNGTPLETDGHQAAKDPSQEIGGLDVHVETIGPDRSRVRHHVLQDAGLEVPAGRIESSRILSQGVKYLFHLEGGGNRLHQGNGPDGGAPETRQNILARGEEISPKCRFPGGLHLGEIEVNPLTPPGLGLAGMKQSQRRAQDAGGNRRSIHQDLRLVQVEPPFPMHEEGKVPFRELVLLSLGGVVEGQGAFHGALPVGCRLQGVHQAVACRVLVVVQIALGPESPRTRIQGVDEHPRDGGRTRDLDPGLVQLLRHLGNAPIAGGGVARRQVRRADTVMERSFHDLGALSPKPVDTARELVVKGQQVVPEFGNHQLVCAWNRSTLDSTAHSLPSS